MTERVAMREQPSGAGDICRRILAELPTWFGIEEANQHYFEVADKGPSVIASVDGEDVGITNIVHHSPTQRRCT